MSKKSDERARLFGRGVIFAIIGLAIILLAIGIHDADPAKAHAPRWFIATIGSVLLLLGLLCIAENGSRLQQIVILLGLAEFFIISGWAGNFSNTADWAGAGFPSLSNDLERILRTLMSIIAFVAFVAFLKIAWDLWCGRKLSGGWIKPYGRGWGIRKTDND